MFASAVKPLFRKDGRALVDHMAHLGAARVVFLPGLSLTADRVIQQGDADRILVELDQVIAGSRDGWSKVLRAKITGAMKMFGRKTNSGFYDLGQQIDLEQFDQTAVRFLRDHLPKIQMEMEDTTRKRVAARVATGIKQGNTITDTASSIRDLFDEMSVSRSQLIAQVETGIATNTGDFINAVQTGLDLLKIWSNSQDEKVRPSHQIREAQEPDALFSNDMLYPLWPDGPIEEIANCRCACLWVPREEVDQWI